MKSVYGTEGRPLMRPIKIFVDSTADLSQELIEKYDLTVTPLYVTIGGKTYKDMLEIHAQDIFDNYYKTKELPKTAAVSVADYIEAFRPVVEAGFDIIHFTISSDFSACYQNACIAAEEIGHVYPVDSRNLSTGIAQLALLAAEEAARGEQDAEHIADYVRSTVPRVDVSFILNNLMFLYKGGRCSGVAALGANVLKLKPCIEVVDGKMGVGKKYRGSFEKCAAEYVYDRIANDDTIDLHRIFLTWSGCDRELIDSLKNDIKSYHNFEEVIDTEAGSTVSGHCGPGCLGVLYIHKEK